MRKGLGIEKYIGQTFNQLEVIGVTEKIKTERKLICKCSCGTITEVKSSHITCGHTKSCGCLFRKGWSSLDKHIGKVYNKLTVIGVGERILIKHSYYRYYLICKCECGNITNVCSSSLIDSPSRNCQKSCGKCGLLRNGIMTSWVALDINKMIPEAEHNYYTGVILNNRNLNVDMALVEDKIAIEYDGSHWHKDKQQQRDRDKTMALIHAGWKVLRIKSRRKIPSKKELLSLVNELKTTDEDLIVLHLKDYKLLET